MKKNDFLKIENDILGQCTEDYIGIWELFWYINNTAPLELDEEEKFKLGLKIFKNFLSQNYIEIFKRIGNKFKKIKMSNKDIEKKLLVLKNNIFEPDLNTENLFWILASKKGEKLYFQEDA